MATIPLRTIQMRAVRRVGPSTLKTTERRERLREEEREAHTHTHTHIALVVSKEMNSWLTAK